MSKILVFGHQNPDSDAIGSSVAFAYLAKEAYGLDTEAVALGTPNEETAFVLDYFGVEAPTVLTSLSFNSFQVILITFSFHQVLRILNPFFCWRFDSF